MSRPTVLITHRWPDAVERELATRYEVVFDEQDAPLSSADLKAALQTADAVCPTVSDRVDADVLGIGDIRARILGNFGVGYNHIDLDAARAAGLVVTNTPGVLTDCTADLAMTLLLMTARRAGEGERHLRAGQWRGWRPTHMMGTKVSGKTLGLIGFGRIARAVAHRAHYGFGMRIAFHTRTAPPAEVRNAYGAVDCATVEDLLAQSDFVSLHCPGGDATRHLINAERLAAMRPSAYLINTARGDVVDQDALVAALKDGRIAGAGLDVYDGEPAVPAELAALDNVVLLPHLGSASLETRTAMGMRVVENLDAFFAGRPPRDRVV